VIANRTELTSSGTTAATISADGWDGCCRNADARRCCWTPRASNVAFSVGHFRDRQCRSLR
jgi:hypothetical protein